MVITSRPITGSAPLKCFSAVARYRGRLPITKVTSSNLSCAATHLSKLQVNQSYSDRQRDTGGDQHAIALFVSLAQLLFQNSGVDRVRNDLPVLAQFRRMRTIEKVLVVEHAVRRLQIALSIVELSQIPIEPLVRYPEEQLLHE